jgi:hypothetical protein
MDLNQTKVILGAVRVAENQTEWISGTLIDSVEHTGAGTYTVRLTRPISLAEVNVKCELFGAPNTGD